jgi:membrane-bound lytic murein transglycosylase D
MNPTFRVWTLCSLVACLSLASAMAMGDDNPVPRPPELERDVQFWIRVYSEITTHSGFLHDERNLGVIYDTLRFTPDTSSRERQRAVDGKRDQIIAALRRIAASTAGELSKDDQRIRDLWGAEATASQLLDATQFIRYQLGQSDRFRAGLERSGAWQAHIAETFASLGLPAQLAVLPHVESSFNPAAYSKVGAAGLWQFMRSTGRRYMRIDNAVDDRMDPFRSTEAAAQLLSYNYRLLGTWPLALTAYNHGAAGMRRAKDAMGTDDIVKILRYHKSPTFGFASRNFYVSFLAALEIDSHPDKYFGSLKRAQEIKFQEVELPAQAPPTLLARALKVDRDRLRELNPSLRPAVWQGHRPVPKGYRLRLPIDGTAWTTEVLAKRLGAEPSVTVAAAQPAPIPPPTVIPVSTSPRVSTPRPKAPAAGAIPTVVAQIESAKDAKAVAVLGKPAIRAEPVTGAQAEALGPSLGPAIETPQSADPTDYSVAANNTITVAADETLGHYAEWLGTSAARLRQVNKLKFGKPVMIGRRIKLEFDKISSDDFEQQRREYHRVLQASYFAAHRIIGTEVYIVRRGDSLWTVTQRSGQLPVWLIQQYNPDVDIGEMRTGVEIVVPKVEEVTANS